MTRLLRGNKQHTIDQLMHTDYWLKMCSPGTGAIYYIRFVDKTYEGPMGSYYIVNMLHDTYFRNGEYHDDPDLVKLQLRKYYHKKHPLNFDMVEPITIYSTEELLDCIQNKVSP